MGRGAPHWKRLMGIQRSHSSRHPDTPWSPMGDRPCHALSSRSSTSTTITLSTPAPAGTHSGHPGWDAGDSRPARSIAAAAGGLPGAEAPLPETPGSGALCVRRCRSRLK